MAAKDGWLICGRQPKAQVAEDGPSSCKVWVHGAAVGPGGEVFFKAPAWRVCFPGSEETCLDRIPKCCHLVLDSG